MHSTICLTLLNRGRKYWSEWNLTKDKEDENNVQLKHIKADRTKIKNEKHISFETGKDTKLKLTESQGTKNKKSIITSVKK